MKPSPVSVEALLLLLMAVITEAMIAVVTMIYATQKQRAPHQTHGSR